MGGSGNDILVIMKSRSKWLSIIIVLSFGFYGINNQV
jgi:hypothetical protein